LPETESKRQTKLTLSLANSKETAATTPSS